MRAILMHGAYDEDDCRHPDRPSPSNRHWFPWLQKQLLLCGIDAQTPEVFESWRFDYRTWAQAFEREFEQSEATILIGHSTGAGFLLRWLSAHPGAQAAALIMVAPYTDPFDVHTDDGFFRFTPDPLLRSRIGSLSIVHSIDDMPEIVASVEGLRALYPDVDEHAHEHMGHFTIESMGTTEFPDLLRVVLAVAGR